MSGLGTSFVVLDLCHVKCKRIDVEKRGKLRDSLVCALLYVKNVTVLEKELIEASTPRSRSCRYCV